MKKVLWISYFFPPLGGTGVLRQIRHVKNLRSFGWEPFVLTVKNGSSGDLKDHSLEEQVEKDIGVCRTFFLDFRVVSRMMANIPYVRRYCGYVNKFIYFFPPDHCVGWIPFSYFAAKKIIKRESIDLVLTCSWPYSSHITGYLLKRTTGVPWIADLPEEWSQYPWREPLFRWQRQLDNKLEQLVLRSADAIINYADTDREMIRSLVPFNIRHKFYTVSGGFDKDDFIETGNRKNKKFTINYIGQFYGGQQPTYFLKALNYLIKSKMILTEKIELIFTGPNKYRASKIINEYYNYSGIVAEGFKNHKEAIKRMQNTDLLLLILSSGRGKGNIPGKTFEYIASGKPILALVPKEGATADLLKKTRTSLAIVEPEDVESIQRAILKLYKAWELGKLEIKPNWHEINKYEGKELTRRLTQVFERVLTGESRQQ